MAYIFASNPDALAQQRNWYDTANINLAQRDQVMRQKAIDDERDAYIFAQRQQQQDARQSAQQAMNYQFAQNEQDRAARQEANRAYEFGAGQRNVAATAAENRRQFDIESGLKEKELGVKTQQYQYEQGKNDFNEVVTAISNDEISDPKQIETVWGKRLSADDLARAHAVYDAKQKGLMDNWNSQNQAAMAATAAVLTPGTPESTTHPWYGFGLYAKTTPAVEAKKLSADEAVKKLIDTNRKELLQYQPLIQWNENSQRFEPIVKPPNFGATNAPAAPTAPAPLTPASSAPVPAGVTPPYQFNVNTPQMLPQSQPNPFPLTSLEPAVDNSRPFFQNLRSAVSTGASRAGDLLKRGYNAFDNLDFLMTAGDRNRRMTATNAPVALMNRGVQTNQFRPGQRVSQGGRIYEFDGRNWNPVQ